MYFKHCQCATPLSSTYLSLSRCIYIYLYIYIYICKYMYILQALTVHHTPLPCLSLHTSSAYQNSELAYTFLSLYDTRGMMETHRGMA